MGPDWLEYLYLARIQKQLHSPNWSQPEIQLPIWNLSAPSTLGHTKNIIGTGINMAPSIPSIIQSLDLSPHHETHDLHNLVRRHMSADVKTNIIFGTISGVIALAAMIQVAILTRKNRVLHCRLLHRENAQSSAVSDQTQATPTQNAQVTRDSTASSNTCPATASHQQTQGGSTRARPRPSTSRVGSVSAVANPSTQIIAQQPRKPNPSPAQALLAVAALLEQALRPLTQSQCNSRPFRFDKASRQS